MNFLNPEILKNCDDVRIGMVKVNQPAISYISYIQTLKLRILKLVINFVKSDMADGASYAESIKDCHGLICSTLTFNDTIYPDSEEELVEEIMLSEEFKNWKTEIKYRFENTHKGVVDVLYPIEVKGTKNPKVMNETVELVVKEDTLQVFLDGLAATNYID
jgi:hypothetical protein